jgi:hypothetical protein
MGELENLTRRAAEAEPLGAAEIRLACDLLFDETLPVESRANFLSNLHRRGETAMEVADFVQVLLERAVRIPWSGAGCLDVCGTGGDKAGAEEPPASETPEEKAAREAAREARRREQMDRQARERLFEQEQGEDEEQEQVEEEEDVVEL